MFKINAFLIACGILGVISAHAKSGEMTITPVPSPSASVVVPVPAPSVPKPSPVAGSLKAPPPVLEDEPAPTPSSSPSSSPSPLASPLAAVFSSASSSATVVNSNWLNFRFSPVGVMQARGNGTVSAFVSWNPEWEFPRQGGYIALNLGGTILGNAENVGFLVLEYQAVLGSRFSPHFGFEFAAGAQTWTKLGGTSFLASGTLYWRPQIASLPFIERVLVSYGGYLQPDFYTNEAKVGVGLRF
jgi:hypothetical protein